MNGLHARLVWRPLRLEAGRAFLAVLAVALGVSVFLAIRLANRAAVASFEGFAQGVGTGAEYVVKAPFGPLDEGDLRRLEPLRDALWIRPVLEGSFCRTGPRGLETFQILATDLVGLGGGGSRVDDGLLDPASVLVSAALGPGDALEGFVDGRAVKLRVAGRIPEAPERPPVQRNLLVMDLPAAQVLLGRPGQLDRLDLGPLPGRSVTPERIAAALPPGWTLEPAEQRASSARAMSGAFRLNLTVLSLIALAVGAYLLFQAFDAAVNRRRETWALLQALGCPRGRILGFVLAEAAILGGLGSLLGIALGWAGAQGAVRFVARTMEALYGAASARHAALGAPEAAAAFVLGTLTCLLAAWVPARRAAATPPVQLLARGAGARPMRWAPAALAGLALLGAGLAVAFLPRLPPGTLWHAYLGSALVLFGGSLAALALLPLIGLPGRTTRSWGLRLALRPLINPTGRHGFAAAALAVAVGMTVGMGVMVRSFEATVEGWIGDSLRADIYVAPLGAGGAGSRHRIPPEAAAALQADPAIAAVDRYQAVPFTFRGQITSLATGDFRVLGTRGHLPMIRGGSSEAVLSRIHRDGLGLPGAVASETFSRRFGVRVGEVLDLGSGRAVTLRGIYGDYGNERGSLILDRPVFLAWLGDARAASLALYLAPGVPAEETARRLAEAHPGLLVRSNVALRSQVERIFHQTFAITYALEVIGLAVALAGLVQSLAGLALARRGDIWTLRALGGGDGAITRVLLGEGCGVALAGCAGGLGLGLLLSRILVQVLNPQAFGWTLAYHLPWGFLGGLTGLCLLAAAAAQLPVARWAARLPADRQAEEGAS
ncbi:FtsX-like permease family protein [Mesoterricola silvestris]|uniref:ABC transporter permease n=1 Tax=Mesoterricola silvestris TaxID=2927979 RepID=A0AA48K8D1_9BACT|nr:FtsX-like permease family protein [Mesoterricola silvestris]BDU72005.1 ABC transporter permease [Mesoterricola silvestris]